MKKITLLFVLFSAISFAQTKQETVLFEHNKFLLTNKAKQKLDSLISHIDINKLKELTLYGNTDADGDSEYNIVLSKKRSKSVFDYIIFKGIPSVKVKLEYNGENNPIAQNNIESGKQQNRRVDLVLEFESNEVVNTIFDKLQTEIQTFEGKSNQEILITGKQGTKIKIPKNSLLKYNGKYAVGTIKIELKEFYKKSDILLANLHTMSNFTMLESGGMIYISATNNDEKLQLKKGAKASIEFASKNNKSDMQIFYGYPKNNGVNWDINETETPQTEDESYTIWTRYLGEDVASIDTTRSTDSRRFVRDSTSQKEFTILDKTILKSAKLNWINCDRFYEVKNKTDLTVTMDLKYKPEIRLVFKDINSVMAGYLDKQNNFVFNNIPVGRKATLIAFSSVEEEIYLVMKEIVIDKNLKVELQLQKTTLEDLKTQLLQLD